MVNTRKKKVKGHANLSKLHQGLNPNIKITPEKTFPSRFFQKYIFCYALHSIFFAIEIGAQTFLKRYIFRHKQLVKYHKIDGQPLFSKPSSFAHNDSGHISFNI